MLNQKLGILENGLSKTREQIYLLTQQEIALQNQIEAVSSLIATEKEQKKKDELEKMKQNIDKKDK